MDGVKKGTKMEHLLLKRTPRFLYSSQWKMNQDEHGSLPRKKSGITRVRGCHGCPRKGREIGAAITKA